MTDNGRTALVTGASGFVGANVVERLLADGWSVRVMTRHPDGLRDQPWFGDVTVVEGGVGDVGPLRRALHGVDVAYYLVHSMSASYDYARLDRDLASTFAEEAGDAGLQRIVYLSGLHPLTGALSEHLESRVEVGQILLDGPVPAAVLQAGIVIGAGSASFDLLQRAVRLPVVVGPTWLDNLVQPVALADAIHYLVAAADLEPSVNRTFDIGTPEPLSYRELLTVFADVLGHRAPKVGTFPVLLPRTTSLWAGIVAPGSTPLNAALVRSLALDMVCHEHDIDRVVGPPPGGVQDVRTAIRSALATAPQVGMEA